MDPNTRLATLSVAQLRESPLNPRRHYDEDKLRELAASIAAKGVIEPLLVRPRPAEGMTDDLFEIACGHRRFRAAQRAGLDRLPCLVREMDDVAFLEVVVIDNLQRDDLHPLEEAEGYKQLMTGAGYDVHRIADRVGRSVKYVYDRVKLLELGAPARRAFLDGRFTAGHAILLARLTPTQQALALDPKGDGLFEQEHTLWSPDEEPDEPAYKPVSVRELAGWIDEHVKFNPRSVDPMLFPETAEALQLVGTGTKERPATLIPITHDHFVQPEARDGQRIYGPRSWKRADGRFKSKPCDKAVLGVVVVGPDRGQAFLVCAAKKGCARHWAAEQRESAHRAKSLGSPDAAQARAQRERLKYDAQQAQEEALRARWTKAMPKILEAVAAAVKKAPARAKGHLGAFLLGQLELSRRAKRVDLVPRGTTAEDLVRHLAFLMLCDEVQAYQAPERFPGVAKAFGLDVQKILDAAAPLPKAAPVQMAAKKKGRRAA